MARRFKLVITATILVGLSATRVLAEVPITLDSDRELAGTIVTVDQYCPDDEAGVFSACGDMAVRVRFHGRTVFVTSLEGDDIAGTYSDAIYEWRGCRDVGLHRVFVTWTRADGITETGRATFRVPRCHYPRPRSVSYGTAAGAAQELVPEDEYVSQVRCWPEGRRGGRAHTWLCGVRANNNWRWCDRFFHLDFWLAADDDERLAGGFGRYERTYFWRKWAPNECHAF